MRAIDIYDLEEGDKILIDLPNGRHKLTVKEVDLGEDFVLVEESAMEFYPNEDGQFIVVED